MRVVRYAPNGADQWNRFIADSKNGTFLFQRGYMDYHSDRFEDHSLVVFDDRDRVVAVIPAHERQGSLVSHNGLTYGGVVSGIAMTAPMMLEVFDAVLDYLGRSKLQSWQYKTVPHIYHRQPAEEDRYALFRAGATLRRVDLLSVVSLPARIEFQERRRRRIRLAEASGLTVRQSTDFSQFWKVLEENLESQHGTKPVHSLTEIELLRSRFPDRIRLHLCADHQAILAGAVIYDADVVAHAQYLATTGQGRERGALDLLLAILIRETYRDRRYFDLGSSNEDEGRVLNRGLIEQKEGFAARSIAHEFFQLSIS